VSRLWEVVAGHSRRRRHGHRARIARWELRLSMMRRRGLLLRL
jgi:hypothetical protein